MKEEVVDLHKLKIEASIEMTDLEAEENDEYMTLKNCHVDDVDEVIEGMFDIPHFYIDENENIKDIDSPLNEIVQLDFASPAWIKVVSRHFHVTCEYENEKMTKMTLENESGRVSIDSEGISFRKGKILRAKELLDSQVLRLFYHYPLLRDAMHVLHCMEGDKYYDLIELPSGGHVPVPILERDFGVGWETLTGIPLGKPRDSETFQCPECGKKSFYSGLCQGCEEIATDMSKGMYQSRHIIRKENEKNELKEIIKNDELLKCRYMRCEIEDVPVRDLIFENEDGLKNFKVIFACKDLYRYPISIPCTDRIGVREIDIIRQLMKENISVEEISSYRKGYNQSTMIVIDEKLARASKLFEHENHIIVWMKDESLNDLTKFDVEIEHENGRREVTLVMKPDEKKILSEWAKEGFKTEWDRKNKNKIWDIALHLWKTLSEMEDQEVADGDPSKFKNEILKSLGYGRMENGCPFCEMYKNDCDGCPLEDIERRIGCNYTPYAAWAEAMLNGRHSQDAAREFYEFLVELREKRGVKNGE